MDIRKAFNLAADQYDQHRRKVIPCFDDFYGVLLSLVPFNHDEKIRVLDLGAGTGLVSALILSVFPNANVTLVDISEEMLSKAKARFAERDGIHFEVIDYARSELSGHFELVVSAMSIHHLEDSAKRCLFKKLYNVLTAGGMFINAEIVRGATEETEKLCRCVWTKHLTLNSGLSKDQLDQIYQRMSYDITATLDEQLDWLREAGFTEVDCFYKYFSFSVYAGTKR
jgi:tRNA (cmo5U34)-methyltransferase